MTVWLRVAELARVRKVAAERRRKDRQLDKYASFGPTSDQYYTLTPKGVIPMAKTLQELFFTKASVKGAPAAHDKALSERCPMLHALLTETSLGGGKTRRVATLSIFAGDGVWKGSLNERDQNLTLWASSDSLEALPGALEAQLALEVITWRARSFGPKERKG